MRMVRISGLVVISIVSLAAALAQEQPRVLVARVVALDQPFMWNRLGAAQPNGTIYALERDVVPLETPVDEFGNDVVPASGAGPLAAGNVRLRSGKRARPIVLRVNEGEILEIEFTNLLAPKPKNVLQVATRNVSAHVMGLELAPDGDKPGMDSDGSWMGSNPGTTGSLAVPGEHRRYRYYASKEGAYILHSGAGWQGSLERSQGGLVGAGLFGSVIVEPRLAEYYRSQVTRDDLARATTGRTPAGQPLLDYRSLSMTRPVGDGRRELIASDLTAIITGPNAGRFPEDDPSPSFRRVEVYPDRRRPYREIVVHYHEFLTTQAFPQFYDPQLFWMLLAAQDNFAINYGMAGIGAEVLANRMGVGPGWRSDSVDLKYEEFFLSSWANGDPSMVVDVPANAPAETITNPAHGSQTRTTNLTPPVFPEELKRGPKATKAFYPDDPSNVYHAYLGDRTKFRIMHTGQGITHIHHQHAHQWLHSPNSDDSTYLDSQLVNPGAAYTLEIANDAGNANKTAGDAIFHCHFYVHFATGMWALWRIHDVFEEGTKLGPDGRPLTGVWNRAYPDAEIATGTPIPAVVPLPTYAMAPMPAEVRLIDDGRRVEVKAASTEGGVARYDNPGYPFFVPGIAGHRAPHPPMDFAVAETADGKPQKDANGKPVLLDGGLPRHMVLGGEIAFEEHTRWDFSKDFIRYQDGKPVAGSLLAYELPNGGTAVERAAMAMHSKEGLPSFTPSGAQKRFRLNGYPPIPGAPFANPRDEEDPDSHWLRYQAAVIQVDAPLNRNGWHQPQQRIITLWEDVAPTVRGDRPLEPMFLRSNSGDTIEYWHTNLVPNKYNLDDFLVRTPSDILGQHIHLVKYDLLAADGAANGFNYEDGTFSPDEVRDRINALNRAGGLFAFDERTQFADKSHQTTLTAKPAPAVFGPPPAGQDWTGAQTTVQVWDSQPVFDEAKHDRTMRTVFTHDHYGPSTHQASGLYAALVTEPKGSRWLDPITGTPMYTRRDGGPTSWRASIITTPESNSFREFNLILQDSQLAWTREARSKPATVTSALFDAEAAEAAALDRRELSPSLRARFSRAGVDLAKDVTVDVTTPGSAWTLREIASKRSFTLKRGTLFTVRDPDGKFASELDAGQLTSGFEFAVALSGLSISSKATVAKNGNGWTLTQPLDWLKNVSTTYPITRGNGTLAFGAIQVSLAGDAPTLADYPYSLNAFFDGANAGNGPPYPLAVNSFPIPGTYSVNYRSEPLPLRVAVPHRGAGSTNDPLALDLAYAFSSSVTRLDAVLNRQPAPGELLDPKQPDGFRFAMRPLLPEGPTGVHPGDPYTPLLRAYEGDQVEIRAIVGANHHPHFFDVQDAMWNFEPAWPDSGFRDSQSLGTSEHFEFLFDLQPGDGQRAFTDRLYRASASTGGLTNGAWGLLRAYDGKNGTALLDDLKPLPNNKGGSAPWHWSDPGLIPQGAVVRHFDIVATTAKQALPDGRLTYNSRGQVTSLAPLTIDPKLAIDDPYALLYVRADDLDANGKLKPGVPIEPLILRVNAGDWIEVKLTNRIPPNDSAFAASAFLPFSSSPPGSAFSTPDQQLNYRPSVNVGLRPQMLAHDPGRGGMNTGFNPTSTAAPGETVTYLWYAGKIEWDPALKETRDVPIEFGATTLEAAEPMQQHRRGLVAALIVEPRGASWTEDRDSRASATVQPANGERAFREFVLIMTDDSLLFSREPLFVIDAAHQADFEQRNFSQPLQSALAAHGLQFSTGTSISIEEQSHFWLLSDQNSVFGVIRRDDGLAVYDCYQQGVNYGTEPLPLRYPLQPAGFDTNATDFTKVFANAQVGGDPLTPIFTAVVGQPVRFRLAHPPGVRPVRPNGVIFMINGHNWQELPFTDRSTRLGNNPLSQQLGSHEQHGPLNRFDILTTAGGRFSVPGDYFYGAFPSDELNGGTWGIFRVLPKGSGTQ